MKGMNTPTLRPRLSWRHRGAKNLPKASRTRIALLLALLGCLLGCSNATDDTTAQGAAPSSRELAARIASLGEVSDNFDQVRSILVARGGELVHEQYFKAEADSYWDVQSVTKSVTSTLIGIAIGEGVIGGVDDTLAQLLPEDVDVMSARVQGITLRQLLTMDSGLAHPVWDGGTRGFTKSNDQVVHEILAHPAAPPGQGFAYSNASSHLLAAIVVQATGTSPLEYARKRLFEPLGIDTTPAWTDKLLPGNVEAYEKADFAWPTDPQGINLGFGGIKFLPRDMVKLGQLFLDGGRWEGKQIVPKEWVDQATTQQIKVGELDYGELDYGYQWWTGDLEGDRSFLAWGYGGQTIVVVPSRDLVVAVTTEVRLNDATSFGIDEGVLLAIIEDGVVSQFPRTN